MTEPAQHADYVVVYAWCNRTLERPAGRYPYPPLDLLAAAVQGLTGQRRR